MSARAPSQNKIPYTGDDWLQVLEACDVQYAVLTQHQDRELIEALRRLPGWSVDFEDDGVVILSRCSQGTAHAQDLHPSRES